MITTTTITITMTLNISSYYKQSSKSFFSWASTPALTLSQEQSSRATVDAFTFMARFVDITGGYIGADFDWNNIVASGGLIHAITMRDFDREQYKNSDIDFFIFADNREDAFDVLDRAVYYIYSKLDKDSTLVFVKYRGPTVTVLVPDRNIKMQFILTDRKSGIEVLQAFDFTHAQIGFLGDRIITTPEYTDAVETGITHVITPNVSAYRIVKAYQRGFSIAMPKRCAINNFIDKNSHLDNHTRRVEGERVHGQPFCWETLQENYQELLNDRIVARNLRDIYWPSQQEIINVKANGTDKSDAIRECFGGFMTVRDDSFPLTSLRQYCIE